MFVNRKILIAGMIFIPATFFAGQLGKKISHIAHGALTHLFNYHYVPTQRFYCSQEECKKQYELFQYDLGVELQIPKEPNAPRAYRRAIMYLHPWGVLALPNKRHAQLMKHYDVLPGDVITFNFPDGVWKGPLPIWHSSLGQISDVMPAIYALNFAVEKLKLEAVDLFGYSRGAAVAVNMLAVLNDKQGKYDKALEQIGIMKSDRVRLLKLIQSGSVVLNCPIIDTNTTLNSYSKPVQFLARKLTNYKDDGLQALQSAQQLAGLNLKVLLHFQHNDTRVTNLKEADLYRAFAQYSPTSTYLVLGDDGGHTHSQEALVNSIHAFYKKAGAAYNAHRADAYEASDTKGLQGLLLQPTIENAEEIISSFHASCEKKKR